MLQAAWKDFGRVRSKQRSFSPTSIPRRAAGRFLFPRAGRDIAMAEPGTTKAICGICGEWMSPEELSRHDQVAHPEVHRLLARAMRRIALITLPAGIGLILTLFFYGGLTNALWDVPIALWATWMILFFTIPVAVIAMRQTSKAYDLAPFRCWVCDTRIPHRDLAAHLRELHPAEAKDYFLARITLYTVAVGRPIAGLVQIVRLLNPSLSPLIGLGPITGLVVFMIPVAVYASPLPPRIPRPRREGGTI